MKTLLRVSVLILAVLAFMGCQPSKYTVTKDEQLFGTWISDRSPEKIVMHGNGTFESYLYRSDKSSWANGQFWIIGKRAKDNTVRYQVDYLEKHPSDIKRKELGNIDMSTRVWEFSSYEASSLDKDRFPVNIDKTHSSYRVYRWVGPE